MVYKKALMSQGNGGARQDGGALRSSNYSREHQRVEGGSGPPAHPQRWIVATTGAPCPAV
eukprot:62779-Pyramimonas_sp.AAC.1